jgi:hypothetical protein
VAPLGERGDAVNDRVYNRLAVIARRLKADARSRNHKRPTFPGLLRQQTVV